MKNGGMAQVDAGIGWESWICVGYQAAMKQARR